MQNPGPEPTLESFINNYGNKELINFLKKTETKMQSASGNVTGFNIPAGTWRKARRNYLRTHSPLQSDKYNDWINPKL